MMNQITVLLQHLRRYVNATVSNIAIIINKIIVILAPLTSEIS